MIIVSKTLKNQSVNFSNKEVKFDENKKATVNKELGELILKNFPKDYWEEGSEPVVAKKEITENKENDSKLETLKEEIERLKLVIFNKDEEIKRVKESEQTWRDEFDKLFKLKSSEVSKEKSSEGENKDDEFIVPDQHKDLFESMKSKNFPTLKKWVKDTFNKTDDDLSEVETRDKLIKFVFEKCEIED